MADLTEAEVSELVERLVRSGAQSNPCILSTELLMRLIDDWRRLQKERDDLRRVAEELAGALRDADEKFKMLGLDGPVLSANSQHLIVQAIRTRICAALAHASEKGIK